MTFSNNRILLGELRRSGTQVYSANDVPAWVQEYATIPYKTHGRDHDGADCWGICGLISLEKYNRRLPSFDDNYHDERDLRNIAGTIAQEKDRDERWLKLDVAQEGAIIIFDLGGEEFFHCGIVIAKRWFFHSMKGIGAGCERLGSTIWRPRIEGFYAFRSDEG